MSDIILHRRSYFEIAAAVTTGLAKLLLVDVMDQKLIFIAVALVFWISYLLRAKRKYSGVMREWGFSKKHFWSVMRTFAPIAGLCVIGFVIYGLMMDTMILSWRILPILVLYPLWGVIQQYLVVGLIAGNLQKLSSPSIPLWLIVLLTAVMFAIVHYPSVLLIAATFIVGAIYTMVYLRRPNLWALGLYHGWLGGLFYYFVLGRDAFLEVFGQLAG